MVFWMSGSAESWRVFAEAAAKIADGDAECVDVCGAEGLSHGEVVVRLIASDRDGWAVAVVPGDGDDVSSRAWDEFVGG